MGNCMICDAQMDRNRGQRSVVVSEPAIKKFIIAVIKAKWTKMIAVIRLRNRHRLHFEMGFLSRHLCRFEFFASESFIWDNKQNNKAIWSICGQSINKIWHTNISSLHTCMPSVRISTISTLKSNENNESERDGKKAVCARLKTYNDQTLLTFTTDESESILQMSNMDVRHLSLLRSVDKMHIFSSLFSSYPILLI